MFGSTWLGGTIYIENLTRAIAALPATEREHIRLSVVVRPSGNDIAGTASRYADRLYIDRFYKAAYLEACKTLAEHVRFIPLSLLNPRKIDFVYPEVAGNRAPYLWGGWIPDFQYRHLPEMFTSSQIDLFDSVYSKLADNAPLIVLSSRMAYDDFERFYGRASSRSVVMNFMSYIDPQWFDGDPRRIQDKYGLPDRFLMVCNQFWKHKDHGTVIEAMGLLKEQGICPVVVFTGSVDARNTGYYRQLLGRVQKLGLGSEARILGFIPRVDQVQLMRRSLAIVQPSLFEGWSTVVEDARSLGKPVLLSDFPVHVEQDPPGALFFQRRNHEELAHLLEKAFMSLAPGPDLEAETAGMKEMEKRLVAYGRRFIEIVHEATGR
jgi:glycosyltransferase involved in cell wall biosynthesis